MKPHGTGALRHYCTIQQNTPIIDEAGQEVESWSALVSSVPCNVTPVTGGERLRGRQVDATATHVVRTRHRDDVTPQMRLIDHKSRTLNIVSVQAVDGREHYMDLQCKEAT